MEEMRNSLYLDAVKTAKLADELQEMNACLTRIDAVKLAKKLREDYEK